MPQDQLDRLKALYYRGDKDGAIRLAYEWTKTRSWTRRDFKDFMELWVELNTTPIPSDAVPPSFAPSGS